ncbi:hypothetical protein D3C77_271320 [compost metagenome]
MKRDRARMTAKRTLDAAHLQSYMRGLLDAFPSGPCYRRGREVQRGRAPLGKPARARSMLHGTNKPLTANLPSSRPTPVLAQVLHDMLPVGGIPNTVPCDHMIQTSRSRHHARLQVTTR